MSILKRAPHPSSQTLDADKSPKRTNAYAGLTGAENQGEEEEEEGVEDAFDTNDTNDATSARRTSWAAHQERRTPDARTP